MKKLRFFITMLLALVMSLSLAMFASCNAFEKISSTDSAPSSESTLPEESSGTGESSSQPESSEPVEDTEAPVITVAGDVTELTAQLGQDLTIPAATAVDNVDDEVEVLVFSETPGAIEEGVFNTNILGQHVITYYACDEAENETYYDVTVNVTSETYAETADITGYNDITVLGTEEGTFKENFEKGLNSPLIYKAMQGAVVLEAGERAINGNSLVLDYSTCVGKENRIFITNTLNYLRSGEWTVSFDVKLVSGTGFNDFYFGYVQNGTVTSKDQNYPLGGLEVGETKHIVWSQLLDLDANGEYFFHIFRLAQDYSDPVVLAFDNFEFTYEEKVYTTTVPSFEEIKAGYTYDWENTYMAITAGAPEKLDEIENAEAKAAIEGATEGFSNVVMHLSGSGAHDLSALTKANDSDFFQTGWVYTFEFWYYGVSAGTTYMIAYDGTSGNNAFKQNVFKAGLNKATIEYVVKGNDYALTFYGDMNVYVGNFNIVCAEPVIERDDYYAPTSEQLKAEGGYTFDWSENNIVAINNNTKYVQISKLEDAELRTTLENTGVYTKDYALKFAGASSSIITFLTGNLVPGQNYTISFDAYAKVKGSVCVLLMNAEGAQEGKADFSVTDNSNGTQFYTTTFNCKEAYNSVNLYIITECEWYLANLTIAETTPVVDDGLVDKIVTGTKAWSDCGFAGKHTVIDTPAEAAGKEGFADKALQHTTPSTNVSWELFRSGDLVANDPNFKSAKFTVYYYVVEITGSGLYINLDNRDFLPIEASVGYHAVTVEITSQFDYFSLYVNGSTSGTFVLGSVSYEISTRGEPTITTNKVNVTNAGVKAWSDCGFAGKHEVVDTSAELLSQVGFDTKALKHTTPSTNVSWELFRSGALVASNETYVSAKFTIYYNVDAISGSGLYINLDNQDFLPIPATVGYHAATVTTTRKFDFFSFYVNGETSATLTLGSIYYEIVSEVEQTSAKTYGKIEASSLNAGSKGTIEATPAEVAGAYGYGENSVKYAMSFGMNDRNIVEVAPLDKITGLDKFKSVTLKVYYYVEPGYNGTLYFFDNNQNFVPLAVTSGYHVAEITLDYGAGWFLFHINAGTGGNVYLGSIEYEVTYNA